MKCLSFIALTAALLCFGPLVPTQAAAASPTIAVFAKGESNVAATEYREGEAIPSGSRYRIHVADLDKGAVTVKAIGPSGSEELLFEGASSSDSPLELPADGDWYELPARTGDLKIMVQQRTASAEYLLHSVDVWAPAEAGRWNRAGDGSSAPTPPGGSNYPLPQNSAELSRNVSTYTRLAVAFAGGKEPVLRGGAGARIFRDAAPGVVLVVVGEGLGSGVILNQSGEILTNWHVVAGAQDIGVMLKPPAGQQLRPTDMHRAHLKRYDEIADIALIEIDRPPADLVALKLGNEGSAEVGSTVHAIGHPLGEYWTYTEGVISQVRAGYEWSSKDKLRHRATVIQTQTPINPGNSGGPLLDDGGAVIGINSFVEQGKQGLNYAISVGEVKRFLAAEGNRKAEVVPQQASAKEEKDVKNCEPRRYKSFIDEKTKKVVTPMDTLCRGRPNLYLVGPAEDRPPEVAFIDDKGDGKFDVKIIFAFDGKTNLWIFYSRRDGVPTAFGYEYGNKGKPDLIVAINAAPQ